MKEYTHSLPMKPIRWTSYGGSFPWVRTSDGLRTHTGGRAGMAQGYFRAMSADLYRPPYSVSGWMKVNAKMNPPRFPDGRPVTYDPSIVFQPLHGSDLTWYSGNEQNVIIRFGGAAQENVSVSAEVGGPGAPYGRRTGYISRYRAPNFDPADGKWHRFDVSVPSLNAYSLSWDGIVLADVVEQEPASFFGGRAGFGLRLDFFDVTVKDVTVTEYPTPPPTLIAGDLNAIMPPTRIVDSRERGKRLLAQDLTPVTFLADVIPANAKAVLASVIAIRPDGDGWLTVWGDGSMPVTSTVNFYRDKTVANVALIPWGGSLSAYSTAAAHLVVDAMAVLL